MAKSKPAAKAHALLIGLNSVDPNHYEGWDGALNVCEADADSIEAIVKKKKFNKVTKLLTKSATRKKVIAALDAAAKALKSGDLFLVYYSGHGGNEIPDTNKDEDDEWHDQFDETWCLYDAQLIDDELFNHWKKFKPGVKILLISDSCFSGDIAKVFRKTLKYPSKAMPKRNGIETYEKHKKFYDKILKKLQTPDIKAFKSTGKTSAIKATLLQISSSQEWQESLAETDKYPANSLFTAVFLELLQATDKKIENYKQLISSVKKIMPDFQSPKHQLLGSKELKILLDKPIFV